MSANPMDLSKVSGSSTLKTQLESTLGASNAGLEFTITGGATYRWNGSSFIEVNTYTGGAAHVFARGNSQNTPAAVTLAAASNTVIATLDVAGMDVLGCQIAVAVRALDTFIIEGRFNALGAYQTLYSTTADYTSPTGVLIGTSGDLTLIAAAASGWFLMDVKGIESVRLSASCVTDDTGTATVSSIGA